MTRSGFKTVAPLALSLLLSAVPVRTFAEPMSGAENCSLNGHGKACSMEMEDRGDAASVPGVANATSQWQGLPSGLLHQDILPLGLVSQYSTNGVLPYGLQKRLDDLLSSIGNSTGIGGTSPVAVIPTNASYYAVGSSLENLDR